MKDEDRILLMLGWSVLLLGIIVLMYKVAYRMDQLDKRLDSLTEQMTAAPETATLTDATVTDATPDEPTEVSMELRPEYNTPTDSLEASETPLEENTEEIDLEESKSVPEASEVVTETYLGVYELTAYAWTGNPCANGNYPSYGYTVACNSLALGTRIYIEGYGEYVVEDRGGMAGNVIDVYMGDYDTCIQFGRRTANVYLIE